MDELSLTIEIAGGTGPYPGCRPESPCPGHGPAPSGSGRGAGGIIKSAREDAGLTRTQLAHIAGVTESTIYRYETDRVSRPFILMVISTVLTSVQFFGETERRAGIDNLRRRLFYWRI